MKPVIYVDVYKSRPPRFRGKARRQPWRWRALSEGNRKILASGESYVNRDDAMKTVELLFGPDSVVYLRQHEQGNQLLRHPEPWPSA